MTRTLTPRTYLWIDYSDISYMRRLPFNGFELFAELLDAFVPAVQIVNRLLDVLPKPQIAHFVGVFHLFHIATDFVDLVVEPHRLFDAGRPGVPIINPFEVVVELFDDLGTVFPRGNRESIFWINHEGALARGFLSRFGGAGK